MTKTIKTLAMISSIIEYSTPPVEIKKREPNPPRKADKFKKRKRKMTQDSRRKNR